MNKNDSVEKIGFLGRSYEEYIQMFNLTKEYLKDQKTLDIASGASSFTPQLLNKGFNITAADVLYNTEPQELEKISSNDFNTLIQAHSGLDCNSDWNFFKNSDDMIKQRTMVYKEFIGSYNKEKGKIYIPAELPSLPFKNNEFSLVLCSHLLFLYDDRLDYDFHLQSLKEMLRVTSREIRIYPLGRSNCKSKFLGQIIKYLSKYAHVDLLKVNYVSKHGGNEMMRIIKKI